MREKIAEVQLVRAIAILGVLLVHSTSDAVSSMRDSNYYILYTFFNVFTKIGTPTFLFLSSFILFYTYATRPLNKQLLVGFYKKRFKYIIIPYCLFSAFYFFLLHIYYPNYTFQETLMTFMTKLATGKAHTHLYFIFINIQFYLLFPLLLWWFQRKPGVVKWIVPLGLALQWAFILANKYVYLHFQLQVSTIGSWSLSYMSYFMLGAYIGIYYPKLKAWLHISKEHASAKRIVAWLILWCCGLISGLAHVYICYNNRLFGISYNSLLYQLLWSVHTYAFALIAFQIAFLLHRHGAYWLNRWMQRLGELSFAIYLLHPFFLAIYRKYPPHTSSSPLHHLWYVGGFLCALLCSWMTVSLLLQVLPNSWVLLGNTPIRRPEQRTVIAATNSN